MGAAGLTRTWRGRSVILTAGLSVSLAAAGGTALAASGPAATARPGVFTAGRVAPASAVPWRKVGAGWVLAEYWPGRFGFEGGGSKAAAAKLYLVDPAGGRYLMHTWKASKEPPFLIDWSGDKARALLGVGTGYEQLTLASGKTSRFSLPGSAQAVGYTRPDGLNILGSVSFGSKTRLARYSLSGHLAKTLATGTEYDSAVYASSGASLAVSGSKGLELVSNGGGVIRKLPVPKTSLAGCDPSRWWSAGTILASCLAKGADSSRLWLIPASGARPRALTPQRGTHSHDLGDVGAWRLSSGLYLQALGPCGTLQIFRQSASGSIKLVTIPGAGGNNNRILTARGSQLLVRAQTGCPGSESLLWFSPSTRHVKMLMKALNGDAGVIGAIPYGKPTSLS